MNPLVKRLHQRRESVWQRVALAPLVPAEGIFGAAAGLRRNLYGRGVLRSVAAPIPVVSVGNLAVGGAGKTPVTIHLVHELQRRGLRVAVLSRGYGGSGRGARVVSRGEGSLLDAADAGDEPVLIARRCPGALVLVGADRAELATIAAKDLGAEIAVLDDGFQHLRLQRDLDIVVLDGAAPFGNGRLLPRGPLREGKEALGRAHLGWIAKCDEGRSVDVEGAAREVEARIGLPPVRSRYRVSRLLSADLQRELPVDSLEGSSVLLLAGLARPDSFRRTLQRAGARVVAEVLFPDHHAFRPREIEGVLARARIVGVDRICCTEKDAVRLPPQIRGDERVAVVQIRTEVVAGADLLSAALDELATVARGRRP